jgi:hypothetical protein
MPWLLALGFGCFLLGMYCLILTKNETHVGFPKYEDPPSLPKKCICHDVDQASPGERCEACSNKKNK